MTDFSIGGIKTSGSINELKQGVSIKEAFEKGKNDKIDQVYFEANGKNYVFQAERVNLNGLRLGAVPANQVNLEGKKIQVEIDGKKMEATISNPTPEYKIEINGKTIQAKNVLVDNEVNTKVEAFGKGVDCLPAKIGMGIGGLTIGAGVLGGLVFGLENLGREVMGRATSEPLGAGKIILGGIGLIAVTVGATGAYGIYKESKTTANPEQLKPLLGKVANF